MNKCSSYTNQTAFTVQIKDFYGSTLTVNINATVSTNTHFTHLKYLGIGDERFRKLL